MAEKQYMDNEGFAKFAKNMGKLFPKAANTEEGDGVIDFADLLGNVFMSFVTGDLQVKNWDSRNFHGVKIIDVDDNSFDFGIGDFNGNVAMICAKGQIVTKNSSSTNAHVEGTTLYL